MKKNMSVLDHYWMPFSDNRYFRTNPRLFESASGMFYKTPDGREVLDATAGLWCVNAGHGRQRIAEAIKRQADVLDYAPSFQLGHPKAFEFAQQLSTFMPAGLDRIFFTNSGSESVDTALKIALAYQRAIGQSSRTRLIGRERAYHGTNLGGTSVGGIGGNRRDFPPLVNGVDHLRHTYRMSSAFTRGQPSADPELYADLERLLGLHGPENIAAVLVEPVACSTGVLVPPRGYLEHLREVTKQNGILLVFDEVITAFGRLGTPTAADYFGVTPDIITMAKGMTNGSIPMGAVAVCRKIQERIFEASPGGIEFFHGYTYSGHPMACAAGLATLELYREENLFVRAKGLAATWEDAVHSLRGCKHVKDVRNLGLMAAIELESRPGQMGARAAEVFRACFDGGMLVRASGDTIALSPPLIIEEKQITEIASRLGTVIAKVA